MCRWPVNILSHVSLIFVFSKSSEKNHINRTLSKRSDLFCTHLELRRQADTMAQTCRSLPFRDRGGESGVQCHHWPRSFWDTWDSVSYWCNKMLKKNQLKDLCGLRSQSPLLLSCGPELRWRWAERVWWAAHSGCREAEIRRDMIRWPSRASSAPSSHPAPPPYSFRHLEMAPSNYKFNG